MLHGFTAFNLWCLFCGPPPPKGNLFFPYSSRKYNVINVHAVPNQRPRKPNIHLPRTANRSIICANSITLITFELKTLYVCYQDIPICKQMWSFYTLQPSLILTAFLSFSKYYFYQLHFKGQIWSFHSLVYIPSMVVKILFTSSMYSIICIYISPCLFLRTSVFLHFFLPWV